MTRLLHTGDTHLGYQQYHVPERRADFLAAFRRVARDAVETEVDAVVHAGDLFHDRRPTLPDLLGAIDVLEELDAAGVPFLAIVGNHEAKRDAQWLDLFENLGLATRLGLDPVDVGDVAVYGLDFVPGSKRANFEPDFGAHDADHATLLAHGLFEPFDHGEWDPTEITEPADVDFDALLLGDNHDPGTAELDGVWLTYCGSTERTSADEREPRGYNLVTFDGDVDIARRGLETREFVFVELDLDEHEGKAHVRERVGQHDLEDAVVAVHLDGEGEPIAPAAIEEYAREQDALVARVTDHRERDTEEAVEVTFADPDAAVRERIRELGLSEAARDVDETIRASKVPDSRMADAVESRVRQLLEDGASTFDPADDTAAERENADPDGGGSSAASTADGSTERIDESEAGDGGAGTPESASGGESTESPEGSEGAEEREREDAGAVSAPVDSSAPDGESGSTEDAPEGRADGNEDQGTLGEFL